MTNHFFLIQEISHKFEKNLALVLALVLVLATAAHADIDPRYHAEAKAAAAHVAVIDIERMRTPRMPTGFCLIEARVSSVERGARLRVGDPLSLSVWCRSARAKPTDSPVQWQSSERMRAARRGRVWLDAEGEILPRRYFEIID